MYADILSFLALEIQKLSYIGDKSNRESYSKIWFKFQD